MPPRKRKAAGSDSDEGGAPAPKKATKAKEPVTPLDPALPTNTTIPMPLTCPPKPEGARIRLAAFNCAGLNASVKKGLKFWIEAEDADVVTLSETKVSAPPKLGWLDARYDHQYWGCDPKKGYAGVAILSKIKPLQVTYGLPTLKEPETSHGRMITLEFDTLYFIGLYVPNAGQGLKNMDAKKAWNEAFERHLRELDSKKPVIFGGDINCAQSDKDLRHAKPNWNKTPGYTQVEIDGLNAQLNPPEDSGHKPLKDVWRHRNPDQIGHYTYYSFRFGCRAKGIGWRLDSFVCSERILDQVVSCDIRHEAYGASDHVPVVLDWKSDL